MNGMDSALSVSSSPYVGWRPFSQSEAGLFFGRTAEARSVEKQWRSTRLTVLHGESAAGKSSLLNAGLVPSLVGRPHMDLLPVARLARSPKMTAVATVVSAWEKQSQHPQSLVSLAAFIQQHDAISGNQARRRHLLGAIDQFESIFFLSPHDRIAFLRDLFLALGHSQTLNLLLVIDDQWLPLLRSQLEARWHEDISYVDLPDLKPNAALEAIIRPTAAAGVSIEKEVAQRLVSQLSHLSAEASIRSYPEPVAAPLVRPLFLQLVCRELLSKIPLSERTITSATLDQVIDLDQVFGNFYDAVIDEVRVVTGKPENILRGWIESTFVAKDGKKRSVRRGSVMTAGLPNEICDAFADRHFLRLLLRSQRTWCELQTDKLVSAVTDINHMWRSSLGYNTFEYDQSSEVAGSFISAAEAALTDGDVATAQRLAAVAASRYSNSGDERRLAHALLLRGAIDLAQGHLDSAEDRFQEALSRFTVLQDRNLTAKTLSALAEVHVLAGDFKKAAEFQQLAIDYLPTDVDALIGLAFAQWYNGSPADADATFSQALAWNTNAGRAWAGRGQVRAEMEEYSLALRDIDRALDCDLSPEDETDVMSARALALVGLGHPSEGDQQLAAARRRDPRRPRTLFRSARVAAMHGQPKVAVQELEEGLEGIPPLSPREASDARKLLISLGRG